MLKTNFYKGTAMLFLFYIKWFNKNKSSNADQFHSDLCWWFLPCLSMCWHNEWIRNLCTVLIICDCRGKKASVRVGGNKLTYINYSLMPNFSPIVQPWEDLALLFWRKSRICVNTFLSHGSSSFGFSALVHQIKFLLTLPRMVLLHTIISEEKETLWETLLPRVNLVSFPAKTFSKSIPSPRWS